MLAASVIRLIIILSFFQLRNKSAEEPTAETKDEDYLAMGESMFENSEYDSAIMQFNEAIELDSTFAYAYYLRGKAYNEIGDKDMAINDFETSKELGHEDAVEDLAWIYFDKK